MTASLPRSKSGFPLSFEAKESPREYTGGLTHEYKGLTQEKHDAEEESPREYKEGLTREYKGLGNQNSMSTFLESSLLDLITLKV